MVLTPATARFWNGGTGAFVVLPGHAVQELAGWPVRAGDSTGSDPLNTNAT